jgi:two-component system, LytTR family, response regulator
MTKTLTAIIVEDMPEAMQLLAHDINYYCPDVTVIGTATSVVSAAKLIREQAPDILFLDISLGDGNGFDLLEIFPNLPSHLIFITASEEYAIRAFRFSATDYLLKPLNSNQLIKAIEKVQRMKNNEKQSLALLRESIKNPDRLPTKISLHTLDKISIINIADIIRCESDSNNTWFFLMDNSKIYVTKTMKYYEDLLSDHQFVRVHQSHLINFNYVQEFLKKEGGFLKMRNNHEVPVSTRKKAEVLAMIGDIG